MHVQSEQENRRKKCCLIYTILTPSCLTVSIIVNYSEASLCQTGELLVGRKGRVSHILDHRFRYTRPLIRTGQTHSVSRSACFVAYLQYRTTKYGTSQNWVSLTYNECKVIVAMTDVTESWFYKIELTSESFQHSIQDALITQETLTQILLSRLLLRSNSYDNHYDRLMR